jgi:hypothetical protein
MDNSEYKDEAYSDKVHELVKFAVSSAKRNLHKMDDKHVQEMLQAHVRTLMTKNNETQQS